MVVWIAAGVGVAVGALLTTRRRGGAWVWIEEAELRAAIRQALED